jgi:hypothetical protein
MLATDDRGEEEQAADASATAANRAAASTVDRPPFVAANQGLRRIVALLDRPAAVVAVLRRSVLHLSNSAPSLACRGGAVPTGTTERRSSRGARPC